MQVPSAIFNTLRERSGNHITQKCVIEVGNFALASKGASASASSEFSSDWPAAAVVNGDRTHINAGSSSVAENNIGGGVWQGNAVADGVGNISEWVVVDLGQSRRVNRIKIIFWPAGTKNGNLGAIAPKDFLIERYVVGGGYGEGGYGEGGYDITGFQPWTGLVDKCAEIGKTIPDPGYGSGGYGVGPYGYSTPSIISGGQVTDNPHDMVVFEDPTPQDVQQVRISISKLQSGSIRARIVAIELTLAVDISDTVTASSRRLAKDYHLARRQAAQLMLSLNNRLGRFNERVTPSAAQVAAGWFNPYIRPNLEVRYYAGFSGVNCQTFTGFIDYWEGTTSARNVKVQCRDFYKFLNKPKITTKLKANWSLEALVELVCNYQNFPTNMMRLDTTTINVAFFMPKDETAGDVLSKLQEATGDSEIYFDEFGRMNYRSYLTVIKHIWRQGNTMSDFAGGTNINDTDWTTQPGFLILANSGGAYAREGNWHSALSPILDGKVQYDAFVPVATTGPYTSVDYFMRVTSDGGATFTPWREIVVSGGQAILGKWNHYAAQAQIWVRLRTSDTTQTPVLNSFTVKYTSRGGSMMVNTSADWATRDNTTLLDLTRRLTDSVGGANYLVSKAIVKSNPTFLGAGSVTAWQGTYNNEPISPTNPMPIPLGPTVIMVDFGKTKYNIPQTVNITLGSAVATTSLTSDPNKPTLTITATVAGTITALTISGTPFVQLGEVEAITYAVQEIRDDYGYNEDTLENEYIDNVDLAESIADNTIRIFGQGPLDWVPNAPIRFAPNAQINDRVTVRDTFTHVDDDYILLGITDELTVDPGGTFSARSTGDLVRIGKNGYAPVIAAHFGSAGKYYYSGFRLGGNYPI
jgi:hypothetical protein